MDYGILEQFLTDYTVGTQHHTYSAKVGNLTIDTTEDLISVNFNDKDHNKYTVTKRVMNEIEKIKEFLTV